MIQSSPKVAPEEIDVRWQNVLSVF